MAANFVVAAQTSTRNLPPGAGAADWVLGTVERVTRILPLDILIVGGREAPDLFRAITEERTRPTSQVFLWYDLLSDYAGMAPAEGVVGWRGQPAAAWGDETVEPRESFRFGCPNNPAVRRKTMAGIELLLGRYGFDGVFFDKIRFPSPANGLEGLFTCFCGHCQRAAAEEGLDLKEVRAGLEGSGSRASRPTSLPLLPGAPWLDALLHDQPVLRRFVRFRADSVTRLVADACAVAERQGRVRSLDLFSPILAPIVGQDYPALGRLAAWAKPMTYRITRAPAGLRLEIPALARLLAERFGTSPDAALDRARETVPSLGRTSLREIEEAGLPLSVAVHELEQAVALLSPAPVYMGLETVSVPGICEATPRTVEEGLAAGRQAGVAGLVMSWDLLDTPLENVRAVARVLAGW